MYRNFPFMNIYNSMILGRTRVSNEQQNAQNMMIPQDRGIFFAGGVCKKPEAPG